MKRRSIWFSLLCALMLLAGCLSFAGSAEGPDTGVPEEAFGDLRIRIEGPDARMPIEISYGDFMDGSYELEGLKAGTYTITELTPEMLLEGYELQEDSVTRTTVVVPENGTGTADLFNHYAPGTPPEDEPAPEPGEEPPEEEPVNYISVSVRKEWDDNNNALGLRPASVTVTLSTGGMYVLHQGNGWSVTVSNLPDRINGEPVTYTWTEQEVPGYTQAYALTNGNHTTLVNRLWQPPEAPAGKKAPKRTGDTWALFEEYQTALGLEIMINHVGDCYE